MHHTTSSTRHITSSIHHITAPTRNLTSPTRTTIANSATSNCCFVVQDVVSEYWWDYYYPDPYVQEKTVSSISTLITTSANETITKHVTRLHKSDITYSYTATEGYNPFQLKFDNAPQPSEVIIANGLTGTETVTAGVTVQSPAPFWVYSSIKIITVPAVTDSHGILVCATTSHGTIEGLVTRALKTTATSIIPSSNGTSAVTKKIVHTNRPLTETTSDIYTISGVNSNAEAYFGGHSILGWSNAYVVATRYEVKPAQTLTNSLGTATIPAYTEEFIDNNFYWVRSNGEIFTYEPPATGTVVIFPTPYIFLPPCGTGDGSDTEPVCTHVNEKQAYGYVPQAVLDHMISDSAIRSMYPGIASCLLGGPSLILQNPGMFGQTGPARLPYRQTHLPGLLPTTDGSDPASTPLQTEASSPSVQSPQPQATPTQPLSQPTTPPGFPESAPSSESLPLGRVPAPIPGTATVIRGSTFAVIPPTTMPIYHAFPISGSTTTNRDGTFIIIPSSTTVLIPPALLVGADISFPGNPEILALPGSTILLSGATPAVVLSPGATVPVNPAYYVEGSTQVVDGTTQVVLAASTTLELPQNEPTIPSLNGITTALPGGAIGVILPSGATVPVNLAYSVEGYTHVVDGTTEVVLAASTTLELPQNLPTLPSLPGITTTLAGGATAVILSAGATVPVNAGYSVKGHTTLVDGTAEVVLEASTTLELPAQNQATLPSLPGITTILPGGAIGVILSAGATVPVNPAYFVNGQTTIIDATTEVILPAPTTLRLSPQKGSSIPSLTGITTILPGGETEVVLPSGATIPLDLKLSLSGRTTIIDGKTEVVLTAPATIPLPTKTPMSGKTKSLHEGSGSKNTGMSTAANSTSLDHGKTTALSSSTGIEGTGSSSQTVASPAGSTVPAKKSGSASIGPGMKFAVVAWIGMILMWSFFV